MNSSQLQNNFTFSELNETCAVRTLHFDRLDNGKIDVNLSRVTNYF